MSWRVIDLQIKEEDFLEICWIGMFVESCRSRMWGNEEADGNSKCENKLRYNLDEIFCKPVKIILNSLKKTCQGVIFRPCNNLSQSWSLKFFKSSENKV